MNGRLGIAAGTALLALAACGEREAEEKLETKAEKLERAAEQAADPVQAQVLANQAKALRAAADGEEKADAEGSVTVIVE